MVFGVAQGTDKLDVTAVGTDHGTYAAPGSAPSGAARADAAGAFAAGALTSPS